VERVPVAPEVLAEDLRMCYDEQKHRVTARVVQADPYYEERDNDREWSEYTTWACVAPWTIKERASTCPPENEVVACLQLMRQVRSGCSSVFVSIYTLWLLSTDCNLYTGVCSFTHRTLTLTLTPTHTHIHTFSLTLRPRAGCEPRH
jgi:hypothetical protein